MKGERIYTIDKSKQPPSRRLLQLYEHMCQMTDFANRFHIDEKGMEKLPKLLSRTRTSIILSFSELARLGIIKLEYKKSNYKRKLYPEMDRTDKEFVYYSQMLHKYGITRDELQVLLDKQGNKCAICSRSQDELGYKLYLDHCHTTDKNRGLLCRECNTGIGYFKDNPDLLNSAITYLSIYK